jgi:hypothetical protein
MISPLGFSVHSTHGDGTGGPAIPVMAVLPKGASVRFLCVGFGNAFVLLDMEHAAPCSGHDCRACFWQRKGALLCAAPVGDYDYCGQTAAFYTSTWEPRCAAHRPPGSRAILGATDGGA